MNLVEDHQRAGVHRPRLVGEGGSSDACVGHGLALELPRAPALAAAEPRIQVQADLARGVGPLHLQVLGRRDHDHLFDRAGFQQLRGDAEGEGRLACPRGCDGEEIGRRQLAVAGQRSHLPGAQPRGRAPRRASGEGWGEVVNRGGRQGSPPRRWLCVQHGEGGHTDPEQVCDGVPHVTIAIGDETPLDELAHDSVYGEQAGDQTDTP